MIQIPSPLIGHALQIRTLVVSLEKEIEDRSGPKRETLDALSIVLNQVSTYAKQLLDPPEMEEATKRINNMRAALGELAATAHLDTARQMKMLSSMSYLLLTEFSAINIEEIIYPDSPKLKQAYELFASIFEEGELDNFELFKENVRKVAKMRQTREIAGETTHFLIAIQGGVVLGAICGTYIPSSNIGFAWYLATRPDARSRELSWPLWNKMEEMFERDSMMAGKGGIVGIFEEIEKDNPWLRAMMRRYGTMPLDIEYNNPKVGDCAASADHYYLCFTPPTASRQKLAYVGGADLRNIILDIFRWGFMIKNPERDPLVKRTLDSIGAREIIPVKTIPGAVA